MARGARNLIFTQANGDALDGVHRQLELGVSAHETDNRRRERYRVGQDEPGLGRQNLSSFASD